MSDKNTSDEGSIAKLPSPPSSVFRRKRLLIIACDGTWADRCTSSKGTVVQEMISLIADTEDQEKVVFYLNGVGTGSHWIEKIVAGATGLGLMKNVITAYNNLVDNYREGDKIILIGYSRGSYTARALAGLLARIGIPRKINQKSLKQLYKKYFNQELKKPEVAEELMNKYNCYRNVQIAALCCFDTVGSLGIPMFGPARILKIFRSKHQFHDTDVTPEVQNNFHAISLNEIREPFELTPMHLPESSCNRLAQVWFPGNHGDIGWENENKGLSDAPLAWTVDQLHTHVGIQLDDAALQARFPAYRASPASHQPPTWRTSRTHHTRSATLTVLGRKPRLPGTYVREGMLTNENVHITARLRSQELPLENIVPGYRHHMDSDGRYYWAKKPTSFTWSRASTPALPPISHVRIAEAVLGDLERVLLGLSCS